MQTSERKKVCVYVEFESGNTNFVRRILRYIREIPYEIGSRRKGDLPNIRASNEKALKILGWKPEKNIKDMIKSTLDAYEKNE